MIDSLFKQLGDRLDMIVVCMDEVTRIALDRLYGSRITLVAMHDFEGQDPELLAVKHTRSHVEYLWTTTPNHILRAMQIRPESEYIAYVDADLEFYSDPSPIFEELGQGNVLIHEHRFPPRIAHLAVSGTYNVGIVVARRCPGSQEILTWWRERCLEWCGSESRGGMLGDQGYLNDWPTRFSGVVVTKNIGVGVAPWNQEQYSLSSTSTGIPLVNGTPVVFYHYHSFAMANPFVILPTVHLDYVPGFSLDVIKRYFLPYIANLHGAVVRAQQAIPGFKMGTMRDNLQVSPYHVIITVKELEGELRKLGFPQPAHTIENNWIALMPAGLTQ